MKNSKSEKIKLSAPQKLKIIRQWEICLEKILPELSMKNQILYMRFFWETSMKETKICTISYSTLKKLCNINSSATLWTALKELVKKRYIKILKREYGSAITYRVYTPLEILTPDKYDKKK